MSTLADSVRAAIEAGDPERVRDLVVGATETERRAIRKSVDDGWWYEHGSPKRHARTLARLGSGTPRQVAADWWVLAFDLRSERSLELAYTVLAARGRDFFATVARALVSDGVQQGALLVRRAVQDGLLDTVPDEEAYVRALVFEVGDWQERDSTYKRLRDDAELREEIWGFFEFDCSTELARADIWEPVDDEPRVQRVEGNRWIVALTRAAEEGLLDRSRLLDASLDALVRDFRPSMVGWYAKMHEALAPTSEERRARLDRYLTLLASPVPSVVKEGLVGLRVLGADVPADELARGIIGPLTQKQKNLAVAALGLLEQTAGREPQARAAVLDAAAHALGHERADVQERALKLLERYPDEAPRAALLGFADAVSPTLRPRVEALTGVAVEPSPVEPVHPEGPAEALVDEPLARVESVDELIELASCLLEGQGSGDDLERLLDGISRLCDERPRGFERRTAGLLKAAVGAEWGWLSGVGLVQAVVASWLTGRRPFSVHLPDTILGFLAHRTLEVASRAAKRKARPLLAFPTHAGGWLDPDVLAERERHVGRLVNRADPADRLQARLHALHDATPITYAPSIVERRNWQPERVLHLEAVGMTDDFGSLGTAVAAVGHAQRSSIWLDPMAWSAWDALGARWCVTVLPAHPEVAFAGAARLIVERLDATPQLYPDVVLEHALDPRVPLGDIAWLAVAGGLAAKSPDLQRVAADVVVASVGDGRFDADGLGGAFAWLLDERLAKASRLDPPLRDVGRVSVDHAAGVARLAEALLAKLRGTPHGLQAPLEAVLEHAARAGLAVERTEARATLERIAGEVSRSSKLGRVSRALLELR